MTSTDQIRARYIDELIGSARMLETVESAAVAEAWASGAVAEWASIGGSPGQLAPRIESSSPLAGALIDWLEGGAAPHSGAEWVADIGAHVLVRAVRLIDGSKSSEIGWIFEYLAPSGDRHDLSVTTVDGVVVGLSVGPGGLAAAAEDDLARGLRIEEVDIDIAVSQVQQSLNGQTSQLSPAAEATLPLLLRRLGVNHEFKDSGTSVDRTMPERDRDDDSYATELIRSALRSQLDTEVPDEVTVARHTFMDRLAVDDPDATVLFEVAGIDPTSDVDLNTFLRLIGAYLAPVDLRAHTDQQFTALVELEPADWIGVILGLSRSPVGTPVDGDVLVRFINRAPEITTTIPAADAPRISWTFEQMLFSWQITGVLDADGAVGEAAHWLLPHAAIAALG